MNEVNHIFKWLSSVKKIYNCLLGIENNTNELYSITENYFDNATAGPTGTLTYSNINLRFKGSAGEEIIVPDVGFTWNYYHGDDFHWYNGHENSGQAQKTHFFWVPKDKPLIWSWAYLNFVVSYLHANEVHERLDPC